MKSKPKAASKPKVIRPKAKPKTKPKAKKPSVGQPLKGTPPLGAGSYVFPIDGRSAWGDSYGAERSDVPGGWHHGDDLFAPLGTPVVAVTDGALLRRLEPGRRLAPLAPRRERQPVLLRPPLRLTRQRGATTHR